MRASFLASAALGVGSIILAQKVLPDAGDFARMRETAALCADELLDHSVITDSPPQACDDFKRGMEVQNWQVSRDLPDGVQHYRLPSSDIFLDDYDSELDNRQNAGRVAVGGSGLLGLMVSFPVVYSIIGGRRERRAEAREARALQYPEAAPEPADVTSEEPAAAEDEDHTAAVHAFVRAHLS